MNLFPAWLAVVLWSWPDLRTPNNPDSTADSTGRRLLALPAVKYSQSDIFTIL